MVLIYNQRLVCSQRLQASKAHLSEVGATQSIVASGRNRQRYSSGTTADSVGPSFQ